MKNLKSLSKLIAGLMLIQLIAITGCKNSGNIQSHINPPFPELDLPFSTFEIAGDAADTIKLNMGTRLFIPANAFVDSAGNIVDEAVTLKYREFRNAAEIFMAGIPMDYQAMNNNTALQTAGMFEIRAFNDNRKLRLAPGKSIKVKMGSRVEGQNYNFFSFDERTGKWQFMGHPETKANPEYAKIEQKIEKLKKTKKYPLTDAYFVFDYSAAFDVTYYELGKKYDKQKMKRRIKQYGARMLDFYTYDRVNYRGRMYKAQFMLWKKLSENKLPYWVRKKHSTTRVKKLSGNVYLLTVKRKDKTYKFRAAIEMPLKVLYAYSPSYLEKHYEEAMQQVEEENKRLAMEAKVYRTFQVNNLGICNYDDLYNPKEALYVKADFGVDFIEDKNMYTGGQIYMVPGNRKSVMTLRSFSGQRVAFDRSDMGVRLFTLLPDGEIGIIDSTQLETLDFQALANEMSPKVKLNFRKWDRTIDSKDDVLALFGI